MVVPCAIGKNGFVPANEAVEGDGKTPLGTYPLRYILYRGDRLDLPDCSLPAYSMGPDDGWCDDPDDPAYNRPVRLPYPARTEAIYRESHVYDIVVVLGHNDDPPVPGLGSAIFFHIAREHYGPTQGCVAISEQDMLKILPQLEPKSQMQIVETL